MANLNIMDMSVEELNANLQEILSYYQLDARSPKKLKKVLEW